MIFFNFCICRTQIYSSAEKVGTIVFKSHMTESLHRWSFSQGTSSYVLLSKLLKWAKINIVLQIICKSNRKADILPTGLMIMDTLSEVRMVNMCSQEQFSLASIEILSPDNVTIPCLFS